MAKLSDEAVSNLIEGHVFKGHTEEWVGASGKVYPAHDWEEQGWSSWHETNSDGIFVEGLGIVTVVETFGGEGQGDDYWMVFNVINDEGSTHYRLDGWYQSYNGGEYEGPLRKVSPVDRVVTFWE